MARGKSVAKEKFGGHMAKLKTTTYPSHPVPRSYPTPIRALAWSPLGNLIATGQNRELKVWNPEKNDAKSVIDLRGHTNGIEALAWNPTMEAELASTGADGTVRFWDVRSRKETAQIKLGGDGLYVSWRPTGHELVVGRRDDALLAIDRRTNTISNTWKQGVQTNQITFSHSGEEMLLTTGDGTVKIVDYPAMKTLYTINGHTSACSSLDLSPVGSYLAIGASDALISLWDTRHFFCYRTLPNITGDVKSVSFSFDGSYIVGGSDEGTTLEIAHAETGEYVHRIEGVSGARSVQWHPKRYALAYGTESPFNCLKIVGAIEGL